MVQQVKEPVTKPNNLILMPEHTWWIEPTPLSYPLTITHGQRQKHAEVHTHIPHI